MLQSALLPTSLFQDIITDLSYNHYGTSLAVASADHRVRIFTLSSSSTHHPGHPSSTAAGGSQGGWELDDEFPAHSAPLTRVSFAHPAYGPILATAAHDRSIKIWEDVPSRSASSQRTRWVTRAEFSDLGASVRSLEWAPEGRGLKVAAVGADGWVRVWECLDLPGLSGWEMREEVDMLSLCGGAGQGSGGATPSAEKELAGGAGGVGGLGGQQGQLGTLARDAARLAAQDRSTQGWNSRASTGAVPFAGAGITGEKDLTAGGGAGGWALAWCPERWWGDVLAVCCAGAGFVKIMHLPSSTSRPVCLATLRPPTTNLPTSSLPPFQAQAPFSAPAHSRRRDQHSHSPHPPQPSAPSTTVSSEDPAVVPLTSVAWAPACGRSFHLIAAGSEGGVVYLWKVVPGQGGMGGPGDQGGLGEGEWEGGVELLGEWEEHGGRPVGRVQFNPTGTLLSSAGDDGKIRLWKASFTGVWRAVGAVYATPGGGGEGGDDMDGDGMEEDDGEGWES